ncbi:phosphoenolpyruvate--protein phosphotransferase [Xanthomonas euvesicatoria pv. euvesicatoria]|uniref:Phosphoenolpyruvate-protein phosphotransferase n=4 Tax=Xanthomonas euvesicatoria TaxID=456327 RepID=Q3BQV7_XANE5|nr:MULTISPECIES: phosphoenolpyruvate--protein phosphotransferase [Xanthomonas]AOY66561.1 phosphoenolpyruvate--protein phosphotransferase [Xanthomonas euvesicatoria pv. vesicatoria str. 85-10]APO89861.1 phosphoenolpyruvate--protein phosphotransferase [Xanthomonas euvesicatoria]KLA92079.1 phosphoenolpyruvate-protein phosphotransferase [Xanthomonas euvesicatoria]KLB36296.1 phosphoenolpyruvate-protein phosphotransferase [Xanthomonas euvesicatoria]KLB41872.1 phosphoenolpyruvate-protein phosphotrans
MSLRLRGHGAARGNALGRARVRQSHTLEVAEQRVPANQVETQLQRLHAAIASARVEMQQLRDRLHGALAREVGEFLELHALLLDDPELLQGLDELIRTHRYSADYALRVQRDRLAAVFDGMEDAYLKSRMDDLDHVIGRIHAFLHKRAPDLKGVAGEILVCDNVAPSELAQLQAQGVVGIVTTAGSTLSHSAILARSLHLPLVVGVSDALQRIEDGDVLIVDAGSGQVIVDPKPEHLRDYRERLRALAKEQRELGRLRSKPTRTRDNVDITLLANAESLEDVANAHALGASGLGLYRTEFLFLQRNELPDEDEQFHTYRDTVLGMSGHPVTIRTLDLGADKADRTGLTLSDEDNPALGLRGVRLSLARPAVAQAQLRAILRASGYGPVRILVPMVSGREEILQLRKQLKKLTAQLRAEGHEIAEHIPLGAMIEVPAAALALDCFIDDIDFLSIGTNDLVQYLLAVDRNNEALGELYSPLHPAVLRLIAQVIATGRTYGKPVAVCGEIAGDPRFVPMLLALGLTEFSLHPATLLEVRRAVRDTHLGELRVHGEKLLRARDRKGIEKWLAGHAQGLLR